ncbi:MAG TPA: glycosyltransferase family 39 protein [Candidatus Binataceae bacterium]|nr:glycosyltransferase family 39 protein [Candidatus Binataceae bacterium]
MRQLDSGAVPSRFDSAATGDIAMSPPFAQDAPASGLIALGFAAVIGLAALLFFFHLGTYGLWEPDEARYAEIAREMLVSQNFVVPHLNYVPYIEKPPLLYWMTTLAMSLLGVNEFAARFVNALAALFGVAATMFFASRTFDSRRAIVAGAVLATSAIYAVMAQVLTTDMLLTAATITAMYAFFLHWRDRGHWCWLAYVAMGLGALTKGPVGVAIPLAVMTIFLYREHDLRGALHRFHAIPGLALTAAIAAPWFVAITIREPGFFDFYFIGEHVRRFFQANYSHNQPIYYYVPIIIGGFLPWTLSVPLIAWRRLTPHPARRYCLIAGGTVFAVFSLSSAKLVPYILPAIPPLAIVIADGLVTVIEDRAAARARRLAALGPLFGIAGAAAIIVGLYAGEFRAPYPALVRPALYAAGALFAIGGIGCFLSFWTPRNALGVLALIVTGAAVLITVSYGRLMAEPLRSYAQLARTIERLQPNARLVCYPRYVQSLPFYTRRRVIIVGARTELTFGSEHDPQAVDYFFIRRADLLKLWYDPRPTVFVVDRFIIDQLRKAIGPYTIIASDPKKLAIMRVDQKAPGSPSTGTTSPRKDL